MSKLTRGIRFRYILAVTALVLLVTFATGFMQYLLFNKQDDAVVINIAGMQRMLSQKALLHAQFLARPEVSLQAKNEARLQLEKASERFEQNHQFLVENSATHTSQSLSELYFASPINLDSRSKQFIHDIRAWQNDDTQALAKLYTQSQQLLPDLDGAVKLFEQQANERILVLRYVELLIWVVAILLLIFEVKFIFKPMEVMVHQGIDELKEQKQQTQLALNVKSRFLARASHELRTPLQATLGYLDLYLQDRKEQYLRQVAASAKQLHVLIDEMHDFSKWSNENIKIEKTIAYLPATIDTVITPYQLVANRKGVILTLHIADGCDQDVLCDHQHLAWVLSQLVDNAVKFSEQGEIHINVQIRRELQQAILVVSVKDQGSGFSDELLQMLSSSSEEDNHFQGMQLGLTRCQLLINALSGQMEISNGSTGGAQVVISIPIEFVSSTQLNSNMSITGKTALLVEDNAVNAIVIKKLLHDIGFEVTHAQHGIAALDILQQQSFDVIFMDLNMPKMDGYEAIDKIRTQLMLQTTVIIVTANNEQQDLDKAMALGGDGYIIKPITAPAIKQALFKLGVHMTCDKTCTN